MELHVVETLASRVGNAGWTTPSSHIASARKMCMEKDANSGNRVGGLCARTVGNARAADWAVAIARTGGEDISARLVSVPLVRLKSIKICIFPIV